MGFLVIAVIFVATYLTLHHGLLNVVKGGFNSTTVGSTGLWVSELIRRVQGLSMTPFPFQWGGFFIVGVLGVTPSAGLVVLFLGWW